MNKMAVFTLEDVNRTFRILKALNRFVSDSLASLRENQILFLTILQVVELLLARGANKEHRNVSDYTPLSLAASGGYVNIIKILLNAGAEINSRQVPFSLLLRGLHPFQKAFWATKLNKLACAYIINKYPCNCLVCRRLQVGRKDF